MIDPATQPTPPQLNPKALWGLQGWLHKQKSFRNLIGSHLLQKNQNAICSPLGYVKCKPPEFPIFIYQTPGYRPIFGNFD